MIHGRKSQIKCIQLSQTRDEKRSEYIAAGKQLR